MDPKADEETKLQEAEDTWGSYSSFKKAEYLMKNAPDCNFVVGQDSENVKTFPCHKWIMQCVSPVFDAMFNGNFKESNQSKEIRVTDAEPTVFKKFLDFIYYANEQSLQFFDITMLRDLIYLGRKYMIASLTDNCIETIKLNLDILENYNLIGVFEYAYLIDDKGLISRCKTVITNRCKSKTTFQSPKDDNLNIQEPKRHTIQLQGRKPSNLSCSNTFTQSSSDIFKFAEPLANKSDGEIKLQNVDIVNPQPLKTVFSFGLNKGDITTCSYIYDLSPSIFNEFQFALKSFISEISRFSLIEMYAKINGVTGESDISSDTIVNNNDKETKNSNEENNEKNANTDKDNNIPVTIKSQVHQQHTYSIASSKQILNMMLRSIDFHRMSAKEFCNGPGKSSLLDIEEKYDLLVTIVYKN